VETVRTALGATCLAADARDVFWSDGNDVWSAPLAGGEPRTLLRTPGKRTIRKLRVVDERVFVLEQEDGDGKCSGRVAWIDRQGSELHPVGDEGCLQDFDVSGDWVVYTTEHNAPFDGGLQSSLWKAKADGGPASDVFNLFDGITHVVTDGKYAYVGLAMDQLHRVALRTAAAEALNEGVIEGKRDGIWHTFFAVDDRYVFFGFGHINLKGATLYRLDKAPGPAEPVALGKMFPPIDGSAGWPAGDLLQTSTHLVWASPEGRVLRVTKDGHCPIEEIATGRQQPGYATPAGKYVVWLDRGGEKRTIARRRVEP